VKLLNINSTKPKVMKKFAFKRGAPCFGLPPKILLIMKLTTFILILALTQVSAKTYSQITLRERNTNVIEVLKQIEKQSGFVFLYDYKDLEATKVSVTVKDVSVNDALKACFENLPFTYTIGDTKTITIRQKEKSFLENIIARFQAIDVRGRVFNESGELMVGAVVRVKGTNNATTTDNNGKFLLKRVDEDAVLQISFIGYVTKEVKARAEDFVVNMELSNSKLDEIHVIAYGTTTQRHTTSNISIVNASEIATQPVNNPLLALSGRVPGLFIQQRGGVSGSGVNVTVQGNNSLENGNDPFYVIDGVPYTPNGPFRMSGQAFAGGTSNFSFINPADIESIEILKDADATAIYGSRAGNGAILITTKKGKAGKTVVDLNSQTGWGNVTRRMKLLNTPQYLQLRDQAFKSTGTTPDISDYDINGIWDRNRQTDWQEELVGGAARLTNIQGSVSGGNENTQFLVSSGYTKETTVYPGDFSDIKASVRFNINHSSTNQKFKLTLSGSYLQDNNNLSTTDLMGIAINLAPNAPALYKPDGTLNWEPSPNNPNAYTFDNPLAVLLQKYSAKNYNLIGNGSVGYEILNGLQLKTTFGYNRLTGDDYNIVPKSSLRPDITYLQRNSHFSNNALTSYIIEPQLAYTKTFFGGQIEALLGSSFQQKDVALQGYSATGFATDGQLTNIGAASNVEKGFSELSVYRYNAIFGRLNYRYQDKYIINLTARRDGSSRFGSENLLNNFYSVGGAWLFAEEKFVKALLPAISSGKLRVTYGTTGNDQIGDYGFLNLYQNYGVEVPYQGTTGISVSGFSNPYLQWEETRKINLGFDLGFFNNAITLTTNYFRSRSSNQLLNDPVPIYTGFGSFKRNIPATVQNTGWEFQLNASPFKGKALNWQTSANLTVPRNKLIAYPNLENSYSSNRYVIGQPADIRKVYNFAGVNAQTGLYEYLGSDGILTSTPLDPADRTLLVNLNPKFYGGFYNSLTYKSFTLDILFQFVKQIGQNYRFGIFPGINANQNEPSNVMDYWKKPGDLVSVQKVSNNFGEIFDPLVAAEQSNAAYSDASYIRLKNASLSYTLPDVWMKKAHITRARFFLQGQNLLTFTKFLGTDPESLAYGSLPPLRLYTIGFQLTL
jgi:TonB-linked SusC/RagA family outer membrane protein